jgi:hypothetical protein
MSVDDGRHVTEGREPWPWLPPLSDSHDLSFAEILSD